MSNRLNRTFIICAVMLLGIVIRCFQLNFPSIGYHNMQENEYLSMAQEMKRNNDFVTKRIYFYNGLEENPAVKLRPQPPLVTYQILFSWRLLGENLWGPRLFNVLFSAASIPLIYFISRMLFANVYLSFFCAFLLAVMPLGVFFSRNLQPETPAFFFMLLGNLFYLRFAHSLKKYNLLLGGLSFSLSWFYKFNFLIGALPFVLCFPFKSLFKEKREITKVALAILSPYLVIAMAIFKLKQLNQWKFLTVDIPKLLEIFSPSYWLQHGNAIWWYTRGENFTYIFVTLAVLGIILAFLKGSGLLNRYIIGWTLTAIIYVLTSPEQIHQQNYSQIPFLGVVCVSSVYAVSFFSETIKKFLKKDPGLYVMIVIIAISIPFIYTSLSRMYSTVFLGEDVAGATLRELTAPQERVFLLTHAQGYAIARYAQRYAGWSFNLKEFKEKEDKFKIRYICIYPAQYLEIIAKNSPELFDYIQGNYHIKEAGVMETPSQLVYLIFEKGSGQVLKDQESISGPIQLKTIYKIFGRYSFFYAVSPAIAEDRK